MPRTAIIAGTVVVTLVASAAVGAYLVARSRLVAVPDVTRLTQTAAIEALEDAGLAFEKAGTQVSVDVPAGSVISQTPAAGRRVKRGSLVSVVVSAGPQSFVVPDLIGSPADGARDALIAMGFEVVVEVVSSDTTEAVVLEMYPAPGTSVNAGDEIRLTVPGDSDSSESLLPYDLEGLTVLLDPAPTSASTTVDAPMEVARRLRALLEAAGATVLSTRAPSGEPTSPTERGASASSSTAGLMVGIDVGTRGVPGVTVYYLPDDEGDDGGPSSEEYGRSITRAATLPTLLVNEPMESQDPVLASFPRQGVRVSVGDAGVPADVQRFADPAWADQVARAIYRGIGTTLAAE